MNKCKTEEECRNKTIQSVLKSLNWKGARMIFPQYEGFNVTIELEDLIKIIKFKENINANT